MSSTRVLTFGTVIALLLAAPVAWGQQPTGDTFFIESIAADADDVQVPVPDPNEYTVDLHLPAGLALRRSFERTEVQMNALPFDTGIAETATTEAALSLGARTTLSFTRTDRTVRDVLYSMIEERTITGMQFEQSFGGGSSAGLLTLSRAVQEDNSPEDGELRTLTQRAMLDTGLGQYGHLRASFTQRESQESVDRLQETGYSADLRMALSGGEGQASYDYLERLAQGRTTQQRTIDLVAPFAVAGGTLTAEHHLKEILSNGNESIDRSTSLAVPLDLVWQGGSASFVEVAKIRGSQESIDRKTTVTLPLDLVWRGASASFVEETKIRDAARDERSILSLAAPFRAFGHDAVLEHISTEITRGDTWQDESVLRLTAQFAGGPGVIERTETTTPAGDAVSRRTRLRVQSPRIRLAEAMSFSANQVREEVDGSEVSRVSNLALTLKPLDPLDVSAGLTLLQRPGAEQLETRNLQTVLALAPGARLRGSISEREQPDGPPIVLRHLELQRERDGGDADVRVGYTSYGDQVAEEDTALLAQVAVGGDGGLGLNATYTEFDEKKLQPLAEPTTTVEVRAGDPTHLGLRAAFTEQAARPVPERSIGLAMSAFGGALRMEFIDNPLDPRGKSVMQSDVYQLAFQREIFGGVNMDLGYRYFLPDDDLPDHFFKLQLDGGQVDRGGLIKLSYLTGHFVPYPRRGDPPASLLDLSYEKRWPGDEGRLTLTLSREEPPQSAALTVDDNIEGEVKFEMRF